MAAPSEPTGDAPPARVVRFRRHDPRVFDRFLGIAILLGSLGMVFAALLFGYAVLRLRSGVWPPAGEEPLPVLLPLLNTLILGASSYTLHRAIAAGKRDRLTELVSNLGVTVALAFAFVVLQSVLWVWIWRSGWLPATGAYYSIFWAFTTLHAAHVLPGFVLLCRALQRARQGRYDSNQLSGLRGMGMYWHFLDAVWLVLFVSLFVL